MAKNLAPDSRDAKHILEYIMAQVVEFKKLNQVGLFLQSEDWVLFYQILDIQLFR